MFRSNSQALLQKKRKPGKVKIKIYKSQQKVETQQGGTQSQVVIRRFKTINREAQKVKEKTDKLKETYGAV